MEVKANIEIDKKQIEILKNKDNTDNTKKLNNFKENIKNKKL